MPCGIAAMSAPQGVDPDSFTANAQPEARPDGTPRLVFNETRDESVLSTRLMLWGGWKGIVSFEGMLDNEMKVVNAHGDSTNDVKFLLELTLTTMASGPATAPVYRFLCVPDTHYTGDRNPTGVDIIRELKNVARFQGNQQQSALAQTEIEYPPERNLHDDHVHTDPTEQYIFSLDSELDELDESDSTSLKDDIETSVQAHKTLKTYVKNQHLYYAVFHTKEVDNEDRRRCYFVYAFAVGVSPHSGNLVGVFCMQSSHNLTS